MQIDGTEVVLIDSSIANVVADLVKRYPEPRNLQAAQLLFTAEEEAVLDKLKGIFWPMLFIAALQDAYRARGLPAPKIGASISFPGGEFFAALSFKV